MCSPSQPLLDLVRRCPLRLLCCLRCPAPLEYLLRLLRGLILSQWIDTISPRMDTVTMDSGAYHQLEFHRSLAFRPRATELQTQLSACLCELLYCDHILSCFVIIFFRCEECQPAFGPQTLPEQQWCGAEDAVKVWHLPTGRLLAQCRGHGRGALSLLWHSGAPLRSQHRCRHS